MGSRHQFHLRWSNYGHNLANSFVRLFESESLADVTLFCEGESYRAHRVVLAASSVHFQELFEQCASARDLVVILDGTSPVNLRALLEFMYKGEVYIDDANLNTFLQTAKRLQVKGLSLSQNDLQSISTDTTDERGGSAQQGGGVAPTTQENILAQALGPLLQPSPAKQNSGGSPPNSFSSSSPSQTPPQNQNSNNLTLNATPHPPSSYSSYPPESTDGGGIGGSSKHKKKFRITAASPKHPSPEGGSSNSNNIPGGGGDDYHHHHHHHHPHPPRPSAPLPSPRMEMEGGGGQVRGMFPGFGPVVVQGGIYQGGPLSLGPPPSPQQQTIVITENPNIRKIRSASTENTMPEDLSIKLEVGRDEELGGLGVKQRSFSMDLSPSEPPFGGGGGPAGPSVGGWSLPSPSNQHGSHDVVSLENAQTTADGKKLKCPFCERLYGYETNLRAHIRQRHQGIRVPCPFCTRTFTRNNTVRRHVAREHRALLGGVGVGVGVRPFHPHPMHGGGGDQQHGGPPGFGSPPTGSTNSSPSQCSPSSNMERGQNNGSGMLSGVQMQQQGAHPSDRGMHVVGASAAAIAAAVAAASGSSNLPLPPSSPPLSSASTGSSRGDRPSSRSSSIGSKPVD